MKPRAHLRNLLTLHREFIEGTENEALHSFKAKFRRGTTTKYQRLFSYSRHLTKAGPCDVEDYSRKARL